MNFTIQDSPRSINTWAKQVLNVMFECYLGPSNAYIHIYIICEFPNSDNAGCSLDLGNCIIALLYLCNLSCYSFISMHMFRNFFAPMNAMKVSTMFQINFCRHFMDYIKYFDQLHSEKGKNVHSNPKWEHVISLFMRQLNTCFNELKVKIKTICYVTEKESATLKLWQKERLNL